MILDNKEKQVFDTGAKREDKEGKGRCDLLPLEQISQLYLIKNEVCNFSEGLTKNEMIRNILREIYLFGESKKEGHLYKAFVWFAKMFYESGGFLETALLELSIHFEEGARIHGENNWKKGLPIEGYLSSGIRHLFKSIRNDRDENHERAFLWNIICAAYESEQVPKPNKGEVSYEQPE